MHVENIQTSPFYLHPWNWITFSCSINSGNGHFDKSGLSNAVISLIVLIEKMTSKFKVGFVSSLTLVHASSVCPYHVWG